MIAITGGYGFLGWHTACRLRAVHGQAARRLGREQMLSAELLAEHLAGIETVIHLAGINRAEDDEQVEQGNVMVAQILAAALERLGRPLHLVYGNSVAHGTATPYGRGKAAAGNILQEAVNRIGGSLADVVLPNLFGEHGRPAYNSFVATFCHEVAHGRSPRITRDRELDLLHAQRAAAVLVEAALLRRHGTVTPTGEPHGVGEVLSRLRDFHRLYAAKGEIPPLLDRFTVDLFNTYRSHLFPQYFPMPVTQHTDGRGRLFEAVRSHGGTGQAFVSTTVPGSVRGDHYHLHKVERFLVVAGDAEIAVRRLLYNEVVLFRVMGDRPAFVDMPTMWTHSIRNVGDSELVTMFWADQLLDPNHSDQFAEQVETLPGAVR